MIDGLTAQGRDVIDIGEVTSDMILSLSAVCSWPVARWSLRESWSGIYNGIKRPRRARPVGIEGGLADVRDAALSGTFKPAPDTAGSVTAKDIGEDWVTHVLSFIDPRS